MRVVMVVLDAPRLKGEDQRHKHQRAHDVLDQVILVEAAVASIVAHNEELQHVEHFVCLITACSNAGEGKRNVPR
jgi:hypothetical protein